ncbi:ABC transporter permease [Microbacterium allomyrinae]|uniref:ABC transporter permease n=1 Tax=Microbacterium allomyrinae TaxID=2830666 RepID=A0A9X1LWW9_9MICO|nr:ABC transporter permease [Microbacterium allomyrinae]MCC2033258.1 ABC transporter permease [Microbacterium allomyrinae]
MTDVPTLIRPDAAQELIDGAPAAEALARVPVARKKHSILVWACAAWLVLIFALAITAPLLPLPSYAIPIGPPRLPPSGESVGFWLGTDNIGRSVISRLIYGAQVSLLVATVSGLFCFFVGGILGLVAGYASKGLDAAVGLFSDVMLAFPPLILLLALSSVLAPNAATIILGLSMLGLPTFIRLSRAHTMSWSAREFVRAARNMGATTPRILFREIMPNVVPALAAYLPIVMSAMIVAEGSLSFLGLGIAPPTPSWGGMIAAGKDSLASDPQLVFIPAAAIFLTVLSLNIVGDQLRVKFDRTVHE